MDVYLFFFSCFAFRFSFGVRCAFFCFSLLPLSLLPLSPMSVSPCLRLTYTGHGESLFVLISDQSSSPTIEYNSCFYKGQEKNRRSPESILMAGSTKLELAAHAVRTDRLCEDTGSDIFGESNLSIPVSDLPSTN